MLLGAVLGADEVFFAIGSDVISVFGFETLLLNSQLGIPAVAGLMSNKSGQRKYEGIAVW